MANEMDSSKIRMMFAKRLGVTQYTKFLRVLNQRARIRGRLFFWQQKIWSAFCDHYSIDPTLDVFKLFAICDIHNCELNSPSKVQLVKNNSSDFREARSERFPYVPTRTTELYCQGCYESYESWMNSKSTIIEPIRVLDVINDHTHTIVGCRMWPRDRQKLENVDAILFETKMGTLRYPVEKYELTHATWSSNEEPRKILIQLRPGESPFNVPIGTKIKLE